jgi:chromate transporter
MMEEEVVSRRRWLSREKFLDLLGATNLIPGPNSTEMAIHIGYLRAGWPGLLMAGAGFIVPATLCVGALAWLYVGFGALPQSEALLWGVKPVVIAVVLQALWSLGRSAVRSRLLAAVAAAALAASLPGSTSFFCWPRPAPQSSRRARGREARRAPSPCWLRPLRPRPCR